MGFIFDERDFIVEQSFAVYPREERSPRVVPQRKVTAGAALACNMKTTFVMFEQ